MQAALPCPVARLEGGPSDMTHTEDNRHQTK